MRVEYFRQSKTGIERKIIVAFICLLVLINVRAVNADDEMVEMETASQETTAQKNTVAKIIIDYLIRHINQKTGLEIKEVLSPKGEGIELRAVKDDGEGMMVLKVKSLSLNSNDVLSESVNASLVLELLVLDGQENEVYARSITGCYEVRVEMLMEQYNIRKLAEAVAKNALSQYAEDPDLRKIVAKLKYGSLGSFAGIF